ncbi:hypothetical protein H4R18_001526 [Coemansia javaensis]|uniref:Zinc/iron permease n=1 Tax=Coemansia javaensis TaxID=2761396 RepID=A0A9W8HHX1_9FUNG|nr:hypothetical protein H4R18_001526 [Coemansia javaensis]
MVAAGRIRLAIAAAVAACAVAAVAQQSTQQTALDEPGSRDAHSVTGHIIFQSADPSRADGQSGEPSGGASASPAEPEPASAETAAPARDAECMATGVEGWDGRLQVGGVFIIMATGLAGAVLPIVSRHVKWLSSGTRVFTLGKFFGAGVILATAFVHMLGAGIETLGDQCLEGRLGGFESWPALLAMLAILAMHLMEHVLTRRIARARPHADALAGAAAGATPSSSLQSEGFEKELHVHAGALFADERRRRLSTYILELGIALHSVIIGMTLAVTGGSEFRVLLAAISVHQFFEGMAVGSRVAALAFRSHPLLLRLLNAAVFALTTPLGQAIGIGIRQSFAPRSPSSLVVMGVLESLSAGILIYSAVVNLLVEEFASPEFAAFGRRLRVACFAATYLGVTAMTVIAKWA